MWQIPCLNHVKPWLARHEKDSDYQHEPCQGLEAIVKEDARLRRIRDHAHKTRTEEASQQLSRAGAEASQQQVADAWCPSLPVVAVGAWIWCWHVGRWKADWRRVRRRIAQRRISSMYRRTLLRNVLSPSRRFHLCALSRASHPSRHEHCGRSILHSLDRSVELPFDALDVVREPINLAKGTPRVTRRAEGSR
jgi:hypothetical protein